jgi:hypothetical protein
LFQPPKTPEQLKEYQKKYYVDVVKKRKRLLTKEEK